MIEVREYIDRRGRSLYRDWIVTLDAATSVRIVTAVLRVEQGNFSAAKPVGSGVSELRLDFGPGFRIYFGRDGDALVVLLTGWRHKETATERHRTGSPALGRIQNAQAGGTIMPLTRSFRDTIHEQLADADFRREFLREAVGNMVSGDLDTAKSILREYVNGTLGFVTLGAALSKSPKSLMRMLSPAGNPQARNLFDMVAYLQRVEHTVLKVHATSAPAA